jgi:hypothetical protein
MDEYPNITVAAHHRDWDGCARIMFRQLFFCTAEEQRKIAARALSAYETIWIEKHPNMPGIPLGPFLNTVEQQEVIFPGNLDPADTEIENAVIEYLNGMSQKIGHAERTAHFATTIRSSILAIQINRWIHDFPDDYKRWQAGLTFSGRTFLDDKNAAHDAENAWADIDALIAKQLASKTNFRRRLQVIPMVKVEEAYNAWERTLL